jgi:hypothetical protein
MKFKPKISQGFIRHNPFPVFQLWRAARDKISRASSLAWPNNYTNPRIVGAFSAVGMIEALQNCQDCRHGKSNLRGGGENTEVVVGKADARPRKSEYNDDTLASREQRQVNIHAEMAIRALPLAISLTTGRTFQCSIELRRRNGSSDGAPNPSHLRLSDSRASSLMPSIRITVSAWERLSASRSKRAHALTPMRSTEHAGAGDPLIQHRYRSTPAWTNRWASTSGLMVDDARDRRLECFFAQIPSSAPSELPV